MGLRYSRSRGRYRVAKVERTVLEVQSESKQVFAIITLTTLTTKLLSGRDVRPRFYNRISLIRIARLFLYQVDTYA